MDNELFRKKALDKIKSPENLNDYVHVTNPGVWLLLVAVIVLLAGAVIWGTFGRIESTEAVSVTVESGVISGTVRGTAVKKGMAIRMDGNEYEIASADWESATGRFRCTVSASAGIPDGTYGAEIVLERIRPISFILN